LRIKIFIFIKEKWFLFFCLTVLFAVHTIGNSAS